MRSSFRNSAYTDIPITHAGKYVNIFTSSVYNCLGLSFIFEKYYIATFTCFF